MFRRKPKPHDHIFRIDFQHAVIGEDRFYCAVKYCNASYIKTHAIIDRPQKDAMSSMIPVQPHKHRYKLDWKTWSTECSYDYLFYVFICKDCGKRVSQSVRQLWDGFVHRV